MSSEVIEYLQVKPGQIIFDGTLGGGGHARKLAELVGVDGRVIAMDRDRSAIERANETLGDLPVTALHGNFCNLPEALEQLGIEKVDGALLDLGISSDQLADEERGFSFHAAGDLDLRMDTSKGEPAWKLIQRLSEKHLADLIYEFGEERASRRVARALVAERQSAELRSAAKIAEIVRRAVPGPRGKIDKATRTFQGLRIAVNEELKSVEIALRRFPACMHAGGRIAVISFHSLEDRIVKDAFRENERFATITKRPVRPTAAEVDQNPRARSAKLRVAEVVGPH